LIRLRRGYPMNASSQMRQHIKSGMVLAICLLALPACTIHPKVEIQSGDTVLEKQLMGEFEQLDRTAILLAPVRGSQQTKSAADAHFRAAIARRAFRLDEINHWVQQGYLTEKQNGTIAPGSKQFPASDHRAGARFKRLWMAENRDRGIIIQHWIQHSDDLSARDRKRIGRLFHRMRLRQLNK